METKIYKKNEVGEIMWDNKQDSIFTGCWVYRIAHVIFWKSKRRLVMAICLG